MSIVQLSHPFQTERKWPTIAALTLISRLLLCVGTNDPNPPSHWPGENEWQTSRSILTPSISHMGHAAPGAIGGNRSPPWLATARGARLYRVRSGPLCWALITAARLSPQATLSPNAITSAASSRTILTGVPYLSRIESALERRHRHESPHRPHPASYRDSDDWGLLWGEVAGVLKETCPWKT